MEAYWARAQRGFGIYVFCVFWFCKCCLMQCGALVCMLHPTATLAACCMFWFMCHTTHIRWQGNRSCGKLDQRLRARSTNAQMPLDGDGMSKVGAGMQLLGL
jgi:hypothetical protein